MAFNCMPEPQICLSFVHVFSVVVKEGRGCLQGRPPCPKLIGALSVFFLLERVDTSHPCALKVHSELIWKTRGIKLLPIASKSMKIEFQHNAQGKH
jgi:hypothetical protein